MIITDFNEMSIEEILTLSRKLDDFELEINDGKIKTAKSSNLKMKWSLQN